jgi:hypothetical protein
MPSIPPKAIKLHLHPYVFPRRFGQRIVDPGKKQYEIEAVDIEFSCPICQEVQAAPPLNDTDYECPKCKWRYKVYDDLLVMWDSRTAGVDLPAHPPGWQPRELVDDGGYGDLDRADAIKEEEIQKWRIAQIRGEDFGATPQIVVPEDLSSSGSSPSSSSSSSESEHE